MSAFLIKFHMRNTDLLLIAIKWKLNIKVTISLFYIIQKIIDTPTKDAHFANHHTWLQDSAPTAHILISAVLSSLRC